MHPLGSRAPRRRLETVALALCVLAAGSAALADPGGAAPSGADAPSPRSSASAAVPIGYLPPGTNASPLPSETIFPPQTIPLRFDHRLHLALDAKPKLRCQHCHRTALTSGAATDRLLPDPVAACDPCHGTDHRNLERVARGPESDGACSTCHLGHAAGQHGRVARVVIPRPNLRNSHRKHRQRNIGCEHCHGSVHRIGLATRDQLPRMAGCFVCHSKSGPAQGKARGRCTTCHLSAPSGTLRTEFAAGVLTPPAWLHGAEHGPDWLGRHRPIAAANSAMCGNCHAGRFCIDCHDGRVRPRNIHPGDWLSMHPQAARQDNPRCTSCHSLQTFCGDCHRRVGVARDGPSAARLAGRRFHPPPAAWSSSPRGPGHHAWEAMRNLNACVACHSERDCATCHATRGLRGGQGIDPHPPGFSSRCAAALRANPRPCYVCHHPADSALRRCQ